MINKYIFFYKLFFIKFFYKKLYKFSLPLPKNNYKPHYYYNTILSKFISNKTFKKLNFLLESILILNKNILILDSNYNYNYLPLSNQLIFTRSKKKFYKLLKYFDISILLYLDLKKKDFFFKKYYKSTLITIVGNNDFFSKKIDLSLNLPNANIYNYMIYIHIMTIYLKIKNKY